MIKNKEDFRQYVEADCKANLNVIRLPWWKEMLFRIYQKDAWMAFDYLRSLRKYEYAINTSRTSIIGRIRTKYYQFLNRKKSIKYNISIGANMVGAGIRIAHVVGGGIIINCKSMGRNCVVNTNILVGNKDTDDSLAIIGDNVELATGSMVIGRVRIGNNAVIAPNAVVTHDVPENAIVGGVPAKVIKYKN